MCASCCCKLGSILALAILTMPAMADQIPSAIAPQGSYHLSPHKPAMEDETVDESNGDLPQPTVNERQSGYATMPRKPAVIENPSNLSITPHKPGVDEMPATPRPPDDAILTAKQNNAQKPENAKSPQSQIQAEPPQSNLIPPTTTSTAHQKAQAAEPTRLQTQKEKRDNAQYRHNPRPYGSNMQVSPMMGLGAACVNSNVTICGKTMPVAAGPIGATINLNAPFPYQPQPFTVQCLAVNGMPAYRIVDATQVSCELQSCAPSDVNICGATVNVPASVKVGSRLKIPIPPSVLSNSETTQNMALRVRCGEGPNSTAAYHIENGAEISCNHFPCQTSTVRLCDATIEVPGGSPLGSVLTLIMPSPFVPDQFVVQCLGTMGRQPAYQIIEHENVGCTRMEGQ